ncbi:MAG: alpha-galactosidase [Erysipelotrichaceae bacterium]|nr:alpha-galactosidase [Erysipelotrichaceae bacterium]
MDIVTIKDNGFILNTRDLSYAFVVDKYKHLEHVHFGSKISANDLDALRLKRNILYGNTLMYDDKHDDIYSLDTLPMEYGTYGRGDFREAAIEIESDGSYSIDFRYDSYELTEGDIAINGLPSSYGAAKTLIIHLRDKDIDLGLDLYYAIYPEENIISRRCILINNSDKDFILHKLMSYSFDMCEQDLTLMDFFGAWNKEAHVNYRDINFGTYVLGSRVGFSSNKNNPGFIIKKRKTGENQGKAWGFNLVYSGNHYSSIARDEYGMVRIQSGISPERFVYDLKAHESFSSPEAVMTYSDRGLNGLSANFHDFINEHIVRSDWKKKERPVLINSWEGFGFDFKKDDLIKKLAKNAVKLGMELFVLDDGWFGRRNSDSKGLGDYDCNLKKIPGGISSLSDEIHKLGMMFGIWVEPESISIDSALYEKHPEFVIKEDNRERIYGRHQLLMDLSKPEVRDYIVENVSRLIDDNNVDYIKWDMNRQMNGVSGVYNHEYIKGLYEVLDRIFTPRGHVLLESCSSGGNRFDLGMMCYSPQIWASDDTDAIERVDIQKGLSYLYPISTMGAHVSASPHMQTLRNVPLETRFNVAAYGCLGYELDLSLLSPLDKMEISKQIAYYKEHRRTFQFGRFYRGDEEADYEVFEMLGEDEAIITKYRRVVHAVPMYDKLYVYGLDRDKTYQINSKPYLHNLKMFGNLINFVSPVKVSSDNVVVGAITQFKGMEASIQEYSASGKALEYGLQLNTLFIGTGYNDNVRIPLDYGSDMYEIKEKD